MGPLTTGRLPADRAAAGTVRDMDVEGYRRLGVAAADAATLCSAAAAGLPGNLILVCSSDTGLAFATACAMAGQALTGEFAHLDVHRAVPDGDRWTIGEVDEKILRPARLKAFERTHIVVADADQMAPAAYDHVLKTVEEPVSGAQFWFAVKDLAAIPTTLHGRSSATLSVSPTPLDQRLELLSQLGADPSTAQTVAQLAGADTRLAVAVATTPDLLEDLRTYATAPLDTPTPTATADALLAAMIRLAPALPAAGEPQTPAQPSGRRSKAPSRRTSKSTLRPRWDSLPDHARADARRLVQRLLDRWTADLVRTVAAADTPRQLQRADRRLQALARAREELATHAPVSTVLPALLARVGAQATDRQSAARASRA